MTPEIIAIVTVGVALASVGVALAGMILNPFKWSNSVSPRNFRL